MENFNFLILGGVGFTGRNIVQILLEQNNANQIIVVDKLRPDFCYMTDFHKDMFKNPKIIYKQKNLGNPTVIQEILETHQIDYVINCVSESRPGMTLKIYEEIIINVGLTCAKTVANCKSVKRFIQLSSCQIYHSNKERKNENGKIEPWTKKAKAFYLLETNLKKIPNLNYIIIRTAYTYGIGDQYDITPRIVITAVYKYLNETMKLMWTKDLIMNTVHIHDLANACIYLCQHGNSGEIYNLADKSNTTQGSLTEILCDIFKIKYEFMGKLESNFAKIDMKGVCENINEKHMEPWSQACNKDKIESTPLSPFLDKEQLSYHHLSIDGSKIESLGFNYKYPKLTKELIQQVIDDLIQNKLFPRI